MLQMQQTCDKIALMTSIPLANLCQYLESFAPSALGEDWDNIGLLVGNRQRNVSRVMTCLTITPESAAEAVQEQADLIITHHPLPFQPQKRITTDTTVGEILLQLIEAKIAVYSPHTAFDSAAEGINQGLAESLGLIEIVPLEPAVEGTVAGGAGRKGRLPQPQSLATIGAWLKQFLKISQVQHVGPLGQMITQVAVACGSAGKFLEHARRHECELFITGEASFHTLLEAEARGVAMLLPGHYASERFGIERLAIAVEKQFPQLTVWPSQRERDPLGTL